MNSLNILPFLFNLVLSFNCSKEFTCQDYETNFEDIKICIDYDPLTRPQKVLNLNGPNVLYRQYLIQQVKHLDQLKEEITIEGKTTFEYQDLRLTWPSECDENEKFYDATLDTMDSFWIHPMSHLCSPHKWPMEIGHHKWSLKAIVIPNAKHEGYNGSFLGSRVVTKCHWSRVRTTQIPLFSLLTTSKSPHLP